MSAGLSHKHRFYLNQTPWDRTRAKRRTPNPIVDRSRFSRVFCSLQRVEQFHRRRKNNLRSSKEINRSIAIEMVSNVSGTESIVSKRNRAIAHALSKHFSLDPKILPSDSIRGHNIKTLFLHVLQLSGNDSHANKDEVLKWVEYAGSFPADAEAFHAKLKSFNEDLVQRSVLLGGLKPSVADIVVFGALHFFVSRLSKAELKKLPHALRWMDYIQSTEDFGEVLEMIVVEKSTFEPYGSNLYDAAHKLVQKLEKLEIDQSAQEGNRGKNADKSEGGSKSNSDKPVAERKVKADGKASEEEETSQGKQSVEKDTDISVSLLNIQVGLIQKAWKHPSADSLLVEEINLGNGNVRQVVSGLAKYCNPEDLVNRRVVLITNVKPGKLRDVMSAGLVLCASNQDHSVVEPLLPPEGATIGERVSFSGHEGKPEDVLNPKKKQLDKITPHLYTDGNGIATYKGIPFMTSAGPCKSSVLNAGIK